MTENNLGQFWMGTREKEKFHRSAPFLRKWGKHSHS